MRPTLLLFTAVLLSACGTKGPLVMPPGPPKPPLFGNPKPVEAKPASTKAPSSAEPSSKSANSPADDNKAPEGQK